MYLRFLNKLKNEIDRTTELEKANAAYIEQTTLVANQQQALKTKQIESFIKPLLVLKSLYSFLTHPEKSTAICKIPQKKKSGLVNLIC